MLDFFIGIILHFVCHPELGNRETKMNSDIKPVGWSIVGVVCIFSGIRLMIRQEIYGRVHVAGAAPMMEGWPVFFFGLGEFLLGVFLLFWFAKKMKS